MWCRNLQILQPPPAPVPQWAEQFAQFTTRLEPAELRCIQWQLLDLFDIVQERREEFEQGPGEGEISSSSSLPEDR